MKLKAREWFPAEGTMEPVVADWVISRENDDYKGSSSSKTEVTLFTGLYDAIGNEVYEGDILRGFDDTIYLIGFDNGSLEAAFDGNCACDAYEICDSSEIIGNKYQNPELLEE